MINLLPKKVKQEFRLYILKRNIIIIGVFLLSIVLLLIIFNSAVWLILYRTQAQIEINNELFVQAQELEKQVSTLNKELSGFINQRLGYVAQIQKEQIVWSLILEKISQITPNGIRLEFLETADNQVQIGGYAKTRDDVSHFQQILEQETQFINFDSPLSNFVKQKDIDFLFSFQIKQ
ncbi:MAG: PilN domain-containing protein [bacterium]